jgi:hypothetical protein
MVSKYKRLSLSILIAFVIVVLVFIFGYFYDSSKISSLSNTLQGYEQNLNQLELAALLINSNSTFSCNFLTSNLDTLSNQLQTLSRELSNSNLASSEVNYSQLNDQYTYVRVDYWLLSNRINQLCGNKFVTAMLIYSINGQDNVVEGDELSFLSSKNSSFIVSAVDGNLNLPLVNLLEKSYNISNSSLPALIIDGKYVKSGYMDTIGIENYICSKAKCLNFSG